MPCINICYKVPEEKAQDVEKTLMDHANFMKSTYVEGSEAIHPSHTYFTKAAELSNPMHPEEGTTGNIIFTINEIWNKPDDIQAHIERASKAPHFERFLAANLEFATMSIMGETLFELK